MSLLFIQHWIPGTVVKAFCWTLIHSLWQGLAVALVVGLIILCTRKTAAALRYNLLTAALLCFLIVSGITFYREFMSAAGQSSSVPVTTVLNEKSAPSLEKTNDIVLSGNDQEENFIVRFTDYFNTHAPLVVLIWFLFFLAKSIQLFAGLHYIHRIRYRRNSSVPEIWKERLDLLCRQAGIHDSIIFLQSELVKIPVVIGVLKPAILVPVGLFTQLTTQQVEAILLHELAHIKRKDFLVNLLQSFTEAIYFFNPAIAWISSLIREEREACCDDIVVAIMPHKKSYLEALVSFQDQTFNPARHAMALGGRKNYLLRRVKRMLTQENKKLNIMEKTILLLGVVGITAFGFISGKDNIDVQPVKESQKIFSAAPVTTKFAPVTEKQIKKKGTEDKPHIKTDTVPKPKKADEAVKAEISFPSLSTSINDDGNTKTSRIEATDNTGKKYVIKKLNNEITEFSVNGTVIPKDQYEKYGGTLDQINEAVMMRQSGEFRARAERSKQAEKRKEEWKDNEKMRKELGEEYKEKIKEQKFRKDEMDKKFEEKRKEEKLNKEERNKKLDQKRMEEKINREEWDKKMEEKRKEQKLNREEWNKKFEEKRKEQNKFREERQDSLRKQISRKMLKPAGTNTEVNGIISYLEQSKIISDRENLSFNFNNNELIVNGVKQPAEVHQKLKEKYLQKSGDYINYSKHGNSTSTSINRE